MTPTQPMFFPILIVGLEKFLRQESLYPYPLELQYAMDMLSVKLGSDFPSTFTDFLNLMELPPERWYPDDDLPAGLDKRISLLCQGQLSELTEDYLLGEELSGLQTATLITHQENKLVQKLLEQARLDYQSASTDEEAERVEGQYATTRRFLIENGFTFPSEIRRCIPRKYRDLVFEMYDTAASRDSQLFHKGKYWQCEHCGPIYVDQHGIQQSIKPSVCSVRCPGSAGWEAVMADSKLLVLKPGIHRRTLIPGKAEIELYAWLADEVRPQTQFLRAVTLYPGVDRYDLRLVFSDGEVWAVDVKDYRDPLALGKHISRDPRPYDLDPRLRWSRTFYVVPDYRAAEHPGYCEKAVREAGLEFLHDIDLVTLSDFKYDVKQKIWEMD